MHTVLSKFKNFYVLIPEDPGPGRSAAEFSRPEEIVNMSVST